MAKPRKRYKPKPVMQIPKIDPWIQHHSGYNYRKSSTCSFFEAFNTFAQDLYDRHLEGLDPVPTRIPTTLSGPQVGFYRKLRSDFIDGEIQFEYTILE